MQVFQNPEIKQKKKYLKNASFSVIKLKIKITIEDMCGNPNILCLIVTAYSSGSTSRTV